MIHPRCFRTIAVLTSHFHKHGTSFLIYVVDGERDRRLYESYRWDHPTIERYDMPIELRAGDRLRLEATYRNDTNNDIFYGARSNDEMCSIFGLVVRGQ